MGDVIPISDNSTDITGDHAPRVVGMVLKSFFEWHINEVICIYNEIISLGVDWLEAINSQVGVGGGAGLGGECWVSL